MDSYKAVTLDIVIGHIFICSRSGKPQSLLSKQQLLPSLTCHHQSEEKLPTPYHSDALCGSHPHTLLTIH